MNTNTIPTYNAEEFEKVNYTFPKNRSTGDNLDFNAFEIHRIEDHTQSIKFPLLPHRKTINDFIYLTEGKVTRSKGLDTFELEEQQLFFLPAHNITSTAYVSHNAKGIYCHFSDDLLTNIQVRELPFFSVSTNPISTIPKIKQNHLEPLLNRLLGMEFKNRDLISLYLQLILVEINQEYFSEKSHSKNSASVITEKFKKLLLQNIYTMQTVADFAAALHISPNHLNKCVKVITNKTAQDWINEMLVLEAKVLLRQTNKSISQIAFELTKQDVSDFGRFFKNRTGLKPSEFRKID